MSTTTTNAIRAAIETLIKGITPAAKHFRNSKYRIGSHLGPIEKRAESDLDREFEVEDITGGNPTVFGATADLDYLGTFLVKIGHAITANRHEGMDRRDTDVQQIVWQVIKAANYPTGVARVGLVGKPAYNELPEFWITTLTFEINYFMAYV